LYSESTKDADGDIGITNKSKISLEEVSADEAGLKKLMSTGSWKAVIKLADKCIATSTNVPQTLQYKICKIVSLMKTRMYKNAFDEISGIGDFNDPVNCYETYTQFSSLGLKGSMIPFTLRQLKSELIVLLGNDPTFDSLYGLLSYCRKEIDRLKTDLRSTGDEKTGETSPVWDSVFDPIELNDNQLSLWRNREHRLMYQIATHLVNQREYVLAITMLEELVSRFPNDISVLSSLGRVHLQMGNSSAAITIFQKAEQANASERGLDEEVTLLMNKGYLQLALEQYQSAIEAFEGVLKIRPNNIAAANNRSICWLYTCELSRAIASLEEVIQSNPENNLDESLVFNLCTLYDLASDRSAEKKKNIMGLVAKYASDSFDFRVLKINN